MHDIADLFRSVPREQHAEVLARLSDEEADELYKQTEGLLSFIPRVSPELSAPNHLAPLVRVIESTLECSRKVVVATPPQHGKTETCLHGLVWLLQREPTRRHAYVTYETDRAQKLSAKAQTIATNAGLEWSGTRKSWKIADGGSVFATGLDSGLTGEAVDGCFPAETKVATEIGELGIEELCGLEYKPLVLAFDHERNRLEYRRIIATRRLSDDVLVTVRTHGGRTIRATADHPFFVRESGYRAASLLRPGDRLVGLRRQAGLSALREGENAGRRDLPSLLRRQARDADHSGMLALWSNDAAPAIRVREAASPRGQELLLLESVSLQRGERASQSARGVARPAEETLLGVRRSGVAAKRKSPLPETSATAATGACTNAARSEDEDVRMQRLVSAENISPAVLLSEMRERSAFAADGGAGQLALQDGDELRGMVQADAPANSAARPDGLRCLPPSEPLGDSPHQRGSTGQCSDESRDDVHFVSRHAPQVEEDTVAAVEWVRGASVAVYDLQVEGHRNFFADGVLVHNCLIVDDPVKDVVEANSATYRQRAEDWFNAVALTRIHPGASAIVIQTRWHPDDLAGRLIARGWEHLTLPAISHEGKALWPEERPLAWLKSQREAIGEYAWAALYEQQPRPRGANVFGDVHLYDPATTPMLGRKVALGVDTAYSERSYADFSVGLVMANVGGKDGKFYVLEVDRAQIKAPVFKERIDRLKKDHSVRQSRWYTSTTEVGLAQMLGVSPVIARTDKFVRAQKYAAAWNAGKVLCPAGAPWLNDFVAEHVAFTGVDDLHDDQVDAGAAAFDELESPAPSYAGLPKIHAPRRF